jgi:CDGSH-type Zn-finger protein
VCRARLEYSPGAVKPPPVRAGIGYDSDGEQVMADPIPAQKEPYGITVEAGKRYFWCACGRSGNQPFCDGSHQGTGLTPVPFTAAASEEVWLCGCKQTSGKPFCDGTHNGL